MIEINKKPMMKFLMIPLLVLSIMFGVAVHAQQPGGANDHVEKPDIAVLGDYTYNGMVQTARLDAFDPNTMTVTGNTAQDAGDYEIKVTPKSGQWKDGSVEAVTVQWTIKKAGREAPQGLKGVAPSSASAADGKITGTSSEMEYRGEGGVFADCTDHEQKFLSAGAYEVRYKQTKNYRASKGTVVEVPQAGLAGQGHITALAFRLENYKFGNKPSSVQLSGQTDNVRIDDYQLLTLDAETGQWVPAKDTLKEGVLYRLKVKFSAKSGYDFDGLTKDQATLEIKNDLSNAVEYDENRKEVIFNLPILKQPVHYTLHFDSKGGSTVDPVTGEENSLIDLAQYQPVREGFDFDGWYADEALTQKVVDVKLTQDTTVYAKWKAQAVVPAPRQEFTITVDPYGGSWGEDAEIKTVKVEKGKYFVLPQAPTREGYTFLFWEGSKHQPGDSYLVEGDHRFTAVWKANAEIGETRPTSPQTSRMTSAVTEGPKPSHTTSETRNMTGKQAPKTGEMTRSLLQLSILLLVIGAVLLVLRRRIKEH